MSGLQWVPEKVRASLCVGKGGPVGPYLRPWLYRDTACQSIYISPRSIFTYDTWGVRVEMTLCDLGSRKVDLFAIQHQPFLLRSIGHLGKGRIVRGTTIRRLPYLANGLFYPNWNKLYLFIGSSVADCRALTWLYLLLNWMFLAVWKSPFLEDMWCVNTGCFFEVSEKSGIFVKDTTVE